MLSVSINMKFLFSLLLSVLLLPFVGESQEEFVENELIIQLEHEVDLEYFLEDFKTKKEGIVLEHKEVLVPSLNIHSFSFKNAEVIDLLESLQKNNKIKFAQPNHSNVQMRRTSNDPNAVGQWYLNKINAPSAWNSTVGGKTIDSQEIVIAIIDVTFEITHDDLKANFWKNKHEIPFNNIDDDNNGYIDDYDGWNVYEDTGFVSAKNPLGQIDAHGTQVAGIIGGVGNNRRDITGLNWKVKMMPVQGSSTNESVVIKSYNYVLEMRKRYNRTKGDSGAFIVAQNSSFGVDKKFANEYPIWCGLLDEMGKAGIVSVGAGPNSEWDIDKEGDIPGTCPSKYLVTVTRSDENDNLFSGGYGKVSMDLAAPGKQIFTTVPGNSTGQASGASFAAPMATAAVGLMYAVYPQKFYALPVDSMASISAIYLRASVEPMASFDLITSSGGRLDLHKAVLLAQDSIGLSKNEVTSSSIGIKMYPNPARSIVNFETNVVGSLQIYNLSGQEMLSYTTEEKSLIVDVSGLKSGLYMVVFETASSVVTKKLNIQH